MGRRADTRRRPVPVDFVEQAKGKTVNALRKLYKTSEKVIVRWVAETGITPARGKIVKNSPAPADFTRWAQVEFIAALARRYDCCPKTIHRWARENGITLKTTIGGFAARPVPEDFRAVAPTMKRAELEAHYKVSEEILRRWIRETGVQPKTAVRWIARSSFVGRTPVNHDHSLAALAKQHLQKFGPVFSSDTLDMAQREKLPNKGKGFHFVAGRGHIPTDEMIALAERKGFDRRAWARI